MRETFGDTAPVRARYPSMRAGMSECYSSSCVTTELFTSSTLAVVTGHFRA
jgi:hypothetical protein